MKKILILLFSLAIGQCFAQNKSNTVSFKTSAVCGMCKQRIERDLGLTKGVSNASLDLKTKIVTVSYNTKKTSPAALKKAITKIGYDADEMLAVQKSHDALPACCQKTAMAHND
jgi:periplasmic mercuric ion binding protein